MNLGSGRETDLGGPLREFPSTCWSRFLARSDGGAALETLAQDYWKPVYAAIRMKGAAGNEEAKDLTQDFFVWMMETDFVSRADPRRGRFRAFIKTALSNYLAGLERRRQTLKRGGGKPILSLSNAPADLAELGIRGEGDADAALDEAWRNELMARAARRLEEQLKAGGKEVQARLFRDFHFRAGGDRPEVAALAAQHGLGEKEAFNLLDYARKRFRTILLDLVAETVGSDDDLRDELRALFGSRFE